MSRKKSNSVTARVEIITPEKAQKLLSDHWKPERQRKPSPSVISGYARSMRAGDWLLTHQGIAIDDRGELIDGVQRLHAVVESGASVPMVITRGLSHNGRQRGLYTIDVIDRGRERAVGQQLQLRHSVTNGALYAATARSVLRLCAAAHSLNTGKFSVSHALRVRDYYGAELAYVVENRSHDYRVRNSVVCAASAFAIKAYPAMRAFYLRLATGEHLTTGDPALTCRRWLMNNPDRPGHPAVPRGVLTCGMRYVNQDKIVKVYDSDRGYTFFVTPQRQTVAKLLRACGFSI